MCHVLLRWSYAEALWSKSIHWTTPRVCFFGMTQIRINNLRSLGSWCIKGTNESWPGVDLLVPWCTMIHLSWIIPKEGTLKFKINDAFEFWLFVIICVLCAGHGGWEREIRSWMWLVVVGCLYVWDAFWWNSFLCRITGGNIQQNHEPHCKFKKFKILVLFTSCYTYSYILVLRIW